MQGPRIVLVAAFVLGVATIAVLGTQGADEAALRSMLRLTARSSLALFLSAFTASALRRLWPNPATAWMLRNRRYLGLSFAVSHAYHLIFIIALHRNFCVETPAPLLYGGGFGFVMLALMAVTSNDASVRQLGPRAWRALHLAGGYTLWAVFAFVYLPAVASPTGLLPSLLPSLGLLGSLGLRIHARRQRSGGS